jgi:Zn-dependent protease with chaperone function
MSETTEAGVAPAESRAPVIAGKVPRLPITRQYKAGLCVVAIVMLLLPVLYLALTYCVGWAVWYHMTANAKMMEHGYLHSVILYLAPLFAGGLLVLFMLKPFVFNIWGGEKNVELRRRDAPEFHAFAENIAAALGVPAPKKIFIDMDANAGARFERRLLGLLSEPVLIVGLPLILTLNVREMSGVIAHEICHLSQKTAMRLIWIIRTVNYWFAYAVYAPGQVEEVLGWASEIGPLSLIFYTAKFMVWIVRSILRGLLIFGYSVSGFMLRQMELDADRYAARIAGSTTAEKVLPRMDPLGVAIPFLSRDLDVAFHAQLMPQDVSPLFLANHRHVLAAGPRALAGVEWGGLQKYLSTHPTHAERAENAHRENSDGIVSDERPVVDIFENFENVSKKFTQEWYRYCTGNVVKTSDSLSVLLKKIGKDPESAAAFERYFGLTPEHFRPSNAFGAPPIAPQNTSAHIESLRAARERVVSESAAWKSAAEVWQSLHEKNRAQHVADILAAGEISAGPPEPDDLSAANETLLGFESRAAERLTLSLQLLQVPEYLAKAAPFTANEINWLTAALTAISDVLPAVLEYRRQHGLLVALGSHLSSRLSWKKVERQMRPQLEAARERLLYIQKTLGRAVYPFEHSREELTIRRYVLPIIPEKPTFEVVGAGDEMLCRLLSLYYAILGRCAFLAEMVEAAIPPETRVEPPIISAPEEPGS